MDPNLCAVQLVSRCSPDENVESIEKLLSALSPIKNQLVLLPENALSFTTKDDYLALAETLGSGFWQTKLSHLAKQHSIYLVCGSFPIKSDIEGKIYTSSLVFSPAGKLISHYHKIHLFDALVADNQAIYKESDTFIAGQKLQLFDWESAQHSYKVGLAICYDLRFPALFQALRAQGADIILLPAAFTQVTGKAHWQALLQARAIENQCYIVAANQGGQHLCGQETYGHSMIISPWGEVLDELEIGEGYVVAQFDKIKLDALRLSMPVAQHNQFISVLK